MAFLHLCLLKFNDWQMTPEVDTVLQVSSQSGVEGENPLSWPAVCAAFAVAQDVFGFPGWEHALLCHAHILLPQGWSFLGAEFELPLVELHEVPVGPFLSPVKAPLEGDTTTWYQALHVSLHVFLSLRSIKAVYRISTQIRIFSVCKMYTVNIFQK